MPSMNLHGEILAERQKKALRLLGPSLADSDFYLAGGTAIALYFGHRRSVDLDWFIETSLADPLLWADELRRRGVPFETGQVAQGTLYGSVHGVLVSFLEFRYPLLDSLSLWSDYGCRLAGLRDLACMKLSAITQRGSRKDFIDLYALLQSGLALAEMLSWYREKFQVKDIGHVLYALVYFDDADAERMPRMVWKVRWPEIKASISAEVKGL